MSIVASISNYSAIWQAVLADYRRAVTISSIACAEREKSRAQRWRIIQDVQTKIFEICQETVVFRARASEKIYNKWDEYVRH
jgi:hypothetical protein